MNGAAPQFAPGFYPAHDRAVVIACDAAYLPYAAVPALTLAAQRGASAGSAPGYDVLIGSPDPLTLPPSLTAAGIGHVAARDPALESALPLDARRSLATYMGVFLARALGSVYRRILVLDADVIVNGGDFGRLLGADMGKHALAAVRDNRQWRNPAKRTPDQRALGRPGRPYFNAGVELIDTTAWAAQDVPSRLAEFARTRLSGLGRDQALSNGVLDGDWAELSPLWNWQYTWASSLLAGIADPFIVHFIGPAKPWRTEAAGVVPPRWRAPYAALPDDIRPADLPPDLSDGSGGRRWPGTATLRRHLWRQWRAAAAMTAYLDRFPDPYRLAFPSD